MTTLHEAQMARFDPGRLLRQIVFSYKALFGWAAPADYLMMKIIEPLIQITFFTFMGQFAGQTPQFYIIGNSVRLVATGGLYGTISVALNERRARTLPLVIASSTPGVQTFYARGMAQIFDGLVTVIVGFSFGALVFGLDFSNVNWALLIVALFVISFGVSGFGLVVATTTLIGTEANLTANLAFNALLLFCGVNFPITALPAPLQAITNVLPLTNGLKAVRLLFDGQVDGVGLLLLTEAALGVVYGLMGYVLFAYAERVARSRGDLDLI